MFTFTFDHAVSDGAGGYGSVVVVTPDGDHWYVGRGFAPTVLVESFPDAGLTYAEAAALTLWLAEAPTSMRAATHGDRGTRRLVSQR